MKLTIKTNRNLPTEWNVGETYVLLNGMIAHVIGKIENDRRGARYQVRLGDNRFGSQYTYYSNGRMENHFNQPNFEYNFNPIQVKKITAEVKRGQKSFGIIEKIK